MSDLWLKHVRQEGLIVSGKVLSELLNLFPVKQHADDTENFCAACSSFRSIADNVLNWPSEFFDPTPDKLIWRLTEMNVTLRANYAVLDADGQVTLLAKVFDDYRDLDERRDFEAWRGITEQQAFERHLRESGIEVGVIATKDIIRLTYSPRGETPGYIEWPIEGMKSTAGRPMLAGLKLLLGKAAIWGRKETNIRTILEASRENQNIVSTKLADQVLGALYTLLRGFTTQTEIRNEMRKVAQSDPQIFYEGLLTVLMRLVFILYAEDRDLMPSSPTPSAKALYENGYSVRRLHADLEDDVANFPDTMADRYGAWGRLTGLFTLIYNGAGQDFMHQRRGKLFDPAAFPFLLGQFDKDDKPTVLPVSDKCIYDVLTQLLILDGEALSYKTLDVEQIGSVYETVMGFTVTRAKGTSIALKSGKGGVPAYVDVDEVLGKARGKRKKYLADTIDYAVTDAQHKKLKPADTVADVLAALDSKIDERGSPGKKTVPEGTIILQPTDERRRTGSHYTPRSLTEPIVRDALAPLLDELGDYATPDEVLALKVCDPAMGSGAFLVEACRALGERLETAWARHPSLIPDEARSDPETAARRQVAKRCLYGVDKNHMATDLAKLSLWLVTLSRDEDFSFLDHALKTGDSLVGLTLNDITGVTWADKTVQPSLPLFAEAFIRRVTNARESRHLIRTAPDNVTFEIQASRQTQIDKELDDVRLGGDAVVATFFEGKKAKERKAALEKLQDLLQLGSAEGWQVARDKVAKLASGNHPIRPFHWEIEFPEVFEGERPGFDSMIGNPPFAGKNTVSQGNRAGYTDWLKTISPCAHGNADLVTHFFRRAYGLIREGGTFGLIATNTIGQGDTRESGLRHLLMDAGGVIYRAQRRVKWPGAAAVVVSTVHTGKGAGVWPAPELDGRPVARISAFLREGDQDETPAVLEENAGIAFQGSIILGMGFTFDDVNAAKGKCEPLSTMHALIEKDPRNAERIKPYLGGDEVNNDPEHKHHRYVIDFEDFPLRRDEDLKLWHEASEAERRDMLRLGIVPRDYNGQVAADWPDLLEIVQRLVKPERATNTQEDRRRLWWRYTRRTPGLAEAIRNNARVLLQNCGASPHLAIGVSQISPVFANTLAVFAVETRSDQALLQSRVHEVWARLLSSSMKDDLRYAPTDCFQTFPMPEGFRDNAALETIATRYLAHRADLMKAAQEGLTKTYNRFHNPLEPDADIETLRRLHAEMDDAVLRAYEWDDLADLCAPGAEFAPRFLTDDHEPEFAYQKRLFWPAPFRDKVLARLLALNRERAAAEKSAYAGQPTKIQPKQLQVESKGTLL